MLIDPHTATGTAAARRLRTDHPVVTMATAHPAKFPDVVEQATGVRPQLPEHVAAQLDRPERTETLPNDLVVVEEFVIGASPRCRREVPTDRGHIGRRGRDFPRVPHRRRG